MKEQELLLLGLLHGGPKHGYQLKKLMRGISANFTGLKTDSIYYPLKKILRDELVTKAVDREGNRPLKYTYEITAKGKEEFKRLLQSAPVFIEQSGHCFFCLGQAHESPGAVFTEEDAWGCVSFLQYVECQVMYPE